MNSIERYVLIFSLVQLVGGVLLLLYPAVLRIPYAIVSIGLGGWLLELRISEEIRKRREAKRGEKP